MLGHGGDVERSQVITRRCTVCGSKIEVTVFEDGTYEGGHYFGTTELPTRGAERISERVEEVEGLGEVTVVEYDDYDEVEYWECEDCYSGVD